MANLATIADAIKAELDAAASEGAFNRVFATNVLWAQRQIKLEKAGVLRVDLEPINHSRMLHARGIHLLAFNFYIGVRKRFESAEEVSGDIADTEVHDMTILLDGLLTFFMPRQPSNTGRPLATFPNAWVLGPGSEGDLKIETTIAWEALETMQQFIGFFPLTIHVPESDAG